MPFDYYDRLSRSQQAIYRLSDQRGRLPLARADELRLLVEALEKALEAEKTAGVQQAAGRLCREICKRLDTEPVSVRVLARRPSSAASELHGLYEREPGRRPRLTVWMRTAQHVRVVKFKTFLRTLLHEMVHHLDYSLLGLEDSFHTQGFFRRESHLVAQLLGPERESDSEREKKKEPALAAARPGRRKPVQLKLF
ncbi:MAG: hypothetical protein JXR96_07170 [Deltaproteobacteria bacterium]|nr:hypothetical protein [Deltaproteobacteria bacterium]